MRSIAARVPRTLVRRPPVKRRALLLAAAFAAVSAAACGGPPPPRHAILVLLDAARADRFSCYGYARETTPRIDALASRGVVFESHFTQGEHTRTALPSLLYSRYYIQPLFPHSARVPFSDPEDLFRKPDDESVSIPAALSAAGLRTVMISAHTWLKPGTAFARQFDEAYDLSGFMSLEKSHAYPTAAQAVDFTLAWIDKHREEDWFVYLHLMDTHFPHAYGEDAAAFMPERWRADPPAGRFTEAGAPRDLRSDLAPRERAYLDALYDGSLHFADRQLGRLFDALGDGLHDTLVAVTSDHGEWLDEVPGRFGHGPPWYDAIAHVPLVVSFPAKLAPGRIAMTSESVDLLPTLLDLLDADLPAGKRPDGVDMVKTAASGRAPREEALARSAIRGERFKALFRTPDEILLGTDPPGEGQLEGKLYDLAADPLETSDVWAQHTGEAAALAARYRDRMKRPYERFVSSVTHDQPASAFAIGAKYVEPEVLMRATSDLGEVERLFGTAAGWLRIEDPEGDLIAAHGEAGSMEVQVPLPNGRYLLTALIRGKATFSTNAASGDRGLEARPFDPAELFPWTTEPVEYGEISVSGGRLSVEIRPDPTSAPFLLGGFGFKPLDHGESMDEEEEKETLERLRALGYVN